MAVSSTGLAYALVILLGVLLIISILQIIQAVHALKRSKAGQPTASRVSLILLATATVALTLGYAFDIMVVALGLVSGSEAPPPSQAYLVGVVISTFLAQGLAPAMIYASASRVIDERKELSGLQAKDVSSSKRRRLTRWTEMFLLLAFPILITAYLGIFCKAVLDTPIIATRYYAWLNVANGCYRAAIVAHAFLFQRLATRAISFHLFSKANGVRDQIMHQPILYHLTPSMFARTVALFAFTPLASSFATAKTPASATALLLAFTFFVGFSTALAAQSLLGGARRPASEWAPPKSTAEQEVHDGDVPGDIDADAPPVVGGHRRKHSRADSIVLSPTRSGFGPGIHIQEETVTH